MRLPLLILTVLALASTLRAQEELSLPLETRFGTLHVGIEVGCNTQGDVCLDYDTLTFHGRRIWTQSRLPDPIHLIPWETNRDLLLIELWSGGASCCRSYRFIVFDADGARFSEEFGNNAYGASDFRIADNEISFSLERDFPANVDHLLVTFDGESIEVETVLEDDTGEPTAGGGNDVLRWFYRRPAQMWEDASERNRFREIMSEANLNCLRTSTESMGSEFVLMDSFLVSSGMWPRQGGSRHGYIAIDLETGTPFAAQFWDGDLIYFGALREDFPAVLREWIETDAGALTSRSIELFGGASESNEYSSHCS